MLSEDMKQILAKLEAIDKKVTDTNTKLTNLQTTVDELVKDSGNLKNEIIDLKTKNYLLQKSVNQLEQYSRKNNVIINGIPVTENEKVRSIVMNLAEKMEITLHELHIAAAHRLPASRNRVPAIVVRFNDSDIKSTLIRESKKQKLNARALGFRENTNIYISDHLSKNSADILKKAKLLREEGKILATWTYNGNVFIRRSETDQARKIAMLEELDSFIEVIHNVGHQESTVATRSKKKHVSKK